MTTEERRKKLIELMSNTDTPLSGTFLGKETGVSRQVVVQDIAILRSTGAEIIATARGYYIESSKKCVRLFKVQHTNDQIEDELNTIVDLGGQVLDVMVNHKAYGKMSGPLNIKSRRDIRELINALASGKSTPLADITSGYHFHNVTADSNHILDEIEQALKEKGYIADFLSYERDL